MRRVPALLLGDVPALQDVTSDALRRWSGDAASIQHIGTGAAYTFRFTTGGAGRYLRLMPPGWRSAVEAEAELAFMDHLWRRGIPLARPVPSAGGERVQMIASPIGECVAMVFEEIAGDAEDDVHWTPDQAREAGRLMARMHLASQDFTLPPGTSRWTWREELDHVALELGDDEPELLRIVEDTREVLERAPADSNVYGMVHFDLSGDNVIWQGMTPAAIDFDDCLYHWYVADLARTLAYFREQEHGAVGPHETAMLEGYRDIRTLSAVEERLLPIVLRISLVSELAWMLHATRQPGSPLQLNGGAEANLRAIIARH